MRSKDDIEKDIFDAKRLGMPTDSFFIELEGLTKPASDEWITSHRVGLIIITSSMALSGMLNLYVMFLWTNSYGPISILYFIPMTISIMIKEKFK